MVPTNRSGNPIPADPLNRPVPGWSLTQPKGKWPWDKPPVHSDPDEVIEKLIDNMEAPKTREQIIKLMFAGISIEELVNTVGMMGFAEGQFNPDVAELIKGPLAIYLMGLADENDVPVRVFANEEKLRREEAGMDDATILEIMRERNPEFAEFVMTMGVDDTPTANPEGFAGVEGDLAVLMSKEVGDEPPVADGEESEEPV